MSIQKNVIQTSGVVLLVMVFSGQAQSPEETKGGFSSGSFKQIPQSKEPVRSNHLITQEKSLWETPSSQSQQTTQPVRSNHLITQEKSQWERDFSKPRDKKFGPKKKTSWDRDQNRHHHSSGRGHRRCNFYSNRYHFYPYIYVAPVVISQPSVSMLFDGEKYYYNEGAFYQTQNGQYVEVPPPIGATVQTIPGGASDVIVNGEVYFYFNGVYYKSTSRGYEVVEPPL